MEAQPLSELYSDLDNEATQRLSAVMRDVVNGKDEVIRTPFLKDLDAEEILHRFTEEVFQPSRSSLNETLQTLEEAQKEKFGPRSIQKPWKDRKDSIYESFADKPISSHFMRDLDDPVVVGGRSQLRPASLSRSYDAMKRTTSAGLPFMRQKGQILDEGINIPERVWPCVLFTRTQEGGKTRPVWGQGIYLLSIEGTMFLPYFELFRNLPYCTAYSGPDAVDEAISKLLYTKGSSDVCISEDFSGFDNSIPPGLSERVFEFIREIFQNNSTISGTFDDISHHFTNIGLVTPDGVLTGPHGIPSGSWFTSVVGSYVHLIAHAAVRKLVPSRNQVMGDDGVIVLPPSLDKEYIADVYSEFNLTLNEDKTFESKDEVLYLQRYYSHDYKVDGVHRGIYPVYRALNRLIHMERWTQLEEIEGAEYFAIRAIAILENCKWHPMHREFVKWVWKQDKYNLEYTSQGLHTFVRKFQPKTSASIKNQYSDDAAGMNAFETVKILKAL